MGESIRINPHAPPNNGMHPTPHHGDSHAGCVGARVMSGVGLPSCYWRMAMNRNLTDDELRVPTTEIDEPVIAININQQYPHAKNADELFKCTSGIWRVSREHANKARYAFAVYQGVIKEVYEIEEWI